MRTGAALFPLLHATSFTPGSLAQV
jgi:hypothetical protein